MVGKVADETEAIDVATLGNFPATKSPPLIYIGAMHTFAPSVADKKVLKQYLTERHGMILGDNHSDGTAFELCAALAGLVRPLTDRFPAKRLAIKPERGVEIFRGNEKMVEAISHGVDFVR